jgi:hypothetical protein
MQDPPPRDQINQTNASAGGDVVGGNKIINYNQGSERDSSVVEQLLERLQSEIEKNAEAKEIIQSLRRYYDKKSVDGIEGLEAKLKAGNRDHEIFLAFEKKELFLKALEKLSLYVSAQEIFGHLLAKVEHEFSMHVFPRIGEKAEHQVNEIITERIVEPIVKECGATVLKMDHSLAMGMLYWLAEQCFVRWHQ